MKIAVLKEYNGGEKNEKIKSGDNSACSSVLLGQRRQR